MKKFLLLAIGWGLSQVAYADRVYNDDLIISGVSDGSAPAYDCSAGALLPLNLAPTPGNTGYFDISGVPTAPVGEPIAAVTPKGPVVNDPATGDPSQEYDCISPIGNMCVGIDCVNGESFGEDTLRLKENNLRIRLVNTAFGNAFGQSWNLEANSSANGGPSYFDFQTKSVEKNFAKVVKAIDGAVPEYDCSIPGTQFSPPDPVGTLKIGDPYIRPQLIDPASNCDYSTPSPYECIWTCQQEMDYEVVSALSLGVSNNAAQLSGAVALGSNSSVEAETVTVGKAELLRRVVNLADAVNDSDLINLKKLNDFSVVAEQSATVAELKQQLIDMNNEIDSINAQIDAIIEETNEVIDSDGDGISDEKDPDDDNDGISDAEEGFYDADGDGLSNSLDSDSDNDGISDKDECPNGSPCPDSDGDGTPDFLDAVDNSGGGSLGWGSMLILLLFGISRRYRL